MIGGEKTPGGAKLLRPPDQNLVYAPGWNIVNIACFKWFKNVRKIILNNEGGGGEIDSE